MIIIIDVQQSLFLLNFSNMGYICFVCKEEISLAHLCSHLKFAHNIVNDEHLFMCYQGGCMRTFTRYNSYRRHIVQSHKDVGFLEPVCSGVGNSGADVNVDVNVDLLETDDPVENCGDITNVTSGLDNDSEAATFVAKMRASSSMTLNNVKMVVDNVSSMVSSIVSHLEQVISSAVKKVGSSSEELLLVNESLRTAFAEVKQPFSNIGTEHHENKYFKNTGTMVEPTEILLGYREDQRINPETGQVNQVRVKET